MDTIVCSKCDKVTPKRPYSSQCEPCELSYVKPTVVHDPQARREYITSLTYKHSEEYKALLEDWQRRIKEANPPVLKESQWIRAVAHFNGCALCSNDYAEVRYQLLIPELGGKYTVLNTIPLCEKCSKVKNRSTNFIKWLTASRTLDKKATTKILKYLEDQYETFKK